MKSPRPPARQPQDDPTPELLTVVSVHTIQLGDTRGYRKRFGGEWRLHPYDELDRIQ